MRQREVTFSRNALSDLAEIFEYVSLKSSPVVAERYLTRLMAACERIGYAGEAGRPRDDLRRGLRSWAVEKQAVITYSIEGDMIVIAKVFHRGRSIEAHYQSGEPLLP